MVKSSCRQTACFKVTKELYIVVKLTTEAGRRRTSLKSQRSKATGNVEPRENRAKFFRGLEARSLVTSTAVSHHTRLPGRQVDNVSRHLRTIRQEHTSIHQNVMKKKEIRIIFSYKIRDAGKSISVTSAYCSNSFHIEVCEGTYVTRYTPTNQTAELLCRLANILCVRTPCLIV